jgi:Fur family transcriptional regulator, ferric uptake regulator
MPPAPSGSPRRTTPQRVAILNALSDADAFLTTQEIHDRLRADGKRVGLATVYRTLQALASNGILDALRNDEGEAIYRRCATPDHHHHLVCRSCGRSVEIASDAVETWASRTARRHGYTSVTHTVEVYGLCRECS